MALFNPVDPVNPVQILRCIWCVDLAPNGTIQVQSVHCEDFLTGLTGLTGLTLRFRPAVGLSRYALLTGLLSRGPIMLRCKKMEFETPSSLPRGTRGFFGLKLLCLRRTIRPMWCTVHDLATFIRRNAWRSSILLARRSTECVGGRRVDPENPVQILRCLGLSLWLSRVNRCRWVMRSPSTTSALSP
jgi:hypothetical protein